MIEEIYKITLLVSWVLLLFSGSYFLIGKIPHKPSYKSYRRSRKIMGMALLVFCFHFFIHWRFGLRDSSPLIAAAFNITSYYLAGILFGMSYISLLDSSYIHKKQLLYDFSKWFILTAIIWGDVFLIKGQLQRIILMISAFLFFLDIVRLSVRFFHTYRKSVQKMKNYYSDEINKFILWMSRSTFGAIGMGLIGAIMAFMPKFMIMIYAALGIVLFIYIFTCFVDYMVYSDIVEAAVSEIPIDLIDEKHTLHPTLITKNTNYDNKLKNNIIKWIATKGYLQNKINIEDLANHLGTHKSYLSNCINSEYSCTFYEWISDLRIEDAKLILIDQPELSTKQIAKQVGFTSDSHFTNLFEEREHVTPNQWRNMML